MKYRFPKFLFGILCILFFCGHICAQQFQKKAALAIHKVLEKQESAWNSGDIESFMEGYWESDSLMFIGSKGLNYGWQVTLNNYKKSYPDTQTMGKLTFTILNMKQLGRKHALVVGKWHLDRNEMENLEGHFSLVWRKIRKKWLIIADHSS